VTDLATPPRSDVPVERTWDAKSVYPSLAAWEEELEGVAAALPGLGALAGRLGESPDMVLDALERRDELTRRMSRAYVYPYLEYAVETTDQSAVARLGRAQAVSAEALAAASFIDPELLSIGRERLSAARNRPGYGPVAPDDDPAFLRQLNKDQEQEQRIRDLEERLAELDDDDPKP